MTAGASLVLVLVFGAVSNAVSHQSGLTLDGEQASVPNAASGQTEGNATVTVTRVVDGDTIDISPSINGLF